MDNKQLLVNLLAQPEKVRPAHVTMLKEALEEYPYMQPLHMLLARAEAQFIPQAALYGNRTALHALVSLDAEPEVEEINDFSFALKEEPEEISVDAEEPELVEETEPEPEQSAVQLEEVILENVANADFFAFEKKLSHETVSRVPEVETVVPEVNFVSKYDDDQLPYTFLWWLAKTRKEHEQIFQPYAHARPVPSSSAVRTAPVEFQQQYVEHIFHIQTPFEVADHLADYNASGIRDVKGAGIIDKFLKEDPTIKPPKPEQIDNENKAKKSAEDHYDLVSETLAKIYIEQMLYHKAIDTYKKLSLKYPEKSRYFADLIQSIEKKL